MAAENIHRINARAVEFKEIPVCIFLEYFMVNIHNNLQTTIMKLQKICIISIASLQQRDRKTHLLPFVPDFLIRFWFGESRRCFSGLFVLGLIVYEIIADERMSSEGRRERPASGI